MGTFQVNVDEDAARLVVDASVCFAGCVRVVLLRAPLFLDLGSCILYLESQQMQPEANSARMQTFQHQEFRTPSQKEWSIFNVFYLVAAANKHALSMGGSSRESVSE